MKKHIKADDLIVKSVEAATVLEKGYAEQLIVRASATTVTLNHGAGQAVAFETKTGVTVGDLVEFNLVGVSDKFKLVGADLAILTDFRRLDNPTGKEFKGHVGKFIETI